MNFYADYVRNKLNAAISSMSSQIEDYVKNPGHDFTRNRKMNFTSTINFLKLMTLPESGRPYSRTIERSIQQ